jgi:hypothetical protein
MFKRLRNKKMRKALNYKSAQEELYSKHSKLVLDMILF